MTMCVIMNVCRDTAVWVYRCTGDVNGSKQREITDCECHFNSMLKCKICYTEMTNLVQFTINVQKSHRQPQSTSQLVCEDRVLFVWLIFAFIYAGSSNQKASEKFFWCIHLSFVHFALHTTPQTKI